MNKIPTTPQELIAALQSDGEIDDERWAQFDTLYRPVIRLFLEQKFGALVAAEAEDLAQDVMVKLIDVFKKRQYKKSKGRFRRYLAAMVNNYAVNALRRRQPERWLSIDTIDPETLDCPAHDRAYDRLEQQWHEAMYQRMTQLYFARFAHDPTDRAVWARLPARRILHRNRATPRQVARSRPPAAQTHTGDASSPRQGMNASIPGGSSERHKGQSLLT